MKSVQGHEEEVESYLKMELLGLILHVWPLSYAVGFFHHAQALGS